MIEEKKLLFDEDYLQNSSKENFYLYLEKKGIDFNDIDAETKLPKFMVKVLKNELSEYTKFNNLLYVLDKENKVSLYEAICYLIEDWFEPNIIFKCLDEMNYLILKNKCIKNNPKLNNLISNLDNIFE